MQAERKHDTNTCTWVSMGRQNHHPTRMPRLCHSFSIRLALEKEGTWGQLLHPQSVPVSRCVRLLTQGLAARVALAPKMCRRDRQFNIGDAGLAELRHFRVQLTIVQNDWEIAPLLGVCGVGGAHLRLDDVIDATRKANW